jgi:hypothetical protein
LVAAPAAGELVNDAKAPAAVDPRFGDVDIGAVAFVDDFDAQPVPTVHEAQLDCALAVDERVVDQFGDDRLCVPEDWRRMLREVRFQQPSSVRPTAALAW